MTWQVSPRLAVVSAWIAFVGIAGGLIAIPTVIAGQPPTINTATADAMAYFRHPEFLVLNGIVAVLVAAIPIVPFGLGLREMTADGDRRAAPAADLGFLLLLVTLPIYVVSSALGAGLTAIASSDATVFAAVHTLYQVLYNGAADVLEGAWIAAFAVAMVLGGRHRWAGWLGLVLAASRWIKALVAVGAMSEAVIPISGVLFLAWFLTVVVLLTRWAGNPARAVADRAPVAAAGSAG